MHWCVFESEADVPDFIDAAVVLHRSIHARLAPDERPHFFNWWLERLNAAHAYLHADAGRPLTPLRPV